MINMILSVDNNGGIGYKNGLPWPKLTEDLKWFRQLTEQNVVVMGSTTWKSLGVHAPLTSRHNYVISSSHNKNDFPGCFAVRDPSQDSIEVILTSLDFNHRNKDIFVIGGRTLYDEAYPFCDAIFLTRVDDSYESDTKCDIDSYIKKFSLFDKKYSKGNQHTPDITFETYLRAGIGKPEEYTQDILF
jgi:dihydrofolate reductase